MFLGDFHSMILIFSHFAMEIYHIEALYPADRDKLRQGENRWHAFESQTQLHRRPLTVLYL